MLDALLQDVRHAVRSFRGSPGFTLIVILTLALSVGANTALFSVLNALVFRTLPVPDPQRLVVIGVEDDKGQTQPLIYNSTFEALRERQRAFETLTLYSGGGLLPVLSRGALVDGAVEGATPEYYTLLGVRPLLGRLLSADDASLTADAALVVVLGARFWQRQFGGDPGVIGDTLLVDGTPLTIVGVTPPDFHGLQVDGGADFLMPIGRLRGISGDVRLPPRGWNVIGRLRPGVSLEQARGEIAAIWPSLQASTLPAGLSATQLMQMRSLHPTVDSLKGGFSSLRKQYASPLAVLVGLAALLLAIGCANLGGLLLARAVTRGPQMAVRIALGATRRRLIQQVAVESLLLSSAGTAVALPLAWWGSRQLGATIWMSALRPLGLSMTPDARVLAVAAAVAVGTGLSVCVLPAWLTTGFQSDIDLRPVRVTTASITRSGRALLVAQVALSMILLVGAGLFANSLVRLRGNESVFARHVTWGRLWLKPGARTARFDAAYLRELVRRFSEMPGAESVAFSMVFPASFNTAGRPDTVARADVLDTTSDVDAIAETVSPSFFETVGITRLRGRDFTWNDDARGKPVTIVSARLASVLFPAGDAVGKSLRISRDPSHRPIEIVGIVADAAIGNFRNPHAAVIFRPMLQELDRARVPIVSVRSRGDAPATTEAMKAIATAAGPHYLRTTSSLERQVDDSLLQERMLASFATAFSALAVMLSAVGLYGFLAYAVARRTREIGVRMALGASRSAVLQMVVGEGVSVATAGIAIGVPGALATGRLTRSLLYGLAPNDPATIVAVSAIFAAVAIGACLIPAYRASSIDPISALRHD
jgi:putative ABC transport system permease protein